ncbi:MAG TPA: hypothetical protein VIF14_16845 [Alphaproteobacteria bacterium]|jgi:hypothetical protein
MAKSSRKDRTAAAEKAAPRPEFSRRVDVSRMGRLEHRMEIKANEEERAALARRFDLVALTELAAALVLKKRGDGIVEVTGRWHARLAQRCVVTLEPVPADLADEVRLFFGGAARAGKAQPAADPLDDEGWPEPIEGGVIDVGEAVVQLLAVALDPYPRAPGVAAADATGR